MQLWLSVASLLAGREGHDSDEGTEITVQRVERDRR